MYYNTWDSTLVGWLEDDKFKDIAILEDADLKNYSERSPNPWNDNDMNNPFQMVSPGNLFEDIGITFKH